MAKLSPEEIRTRLANLPGWEHKGNAIGKLFRFKEFMDGGAGRHGRCPWQDCLEGRIIRPRTDALLAYKRAPFLLPTMRLLNSTPSLPELIHWTGTH